MQRVPPELVYSFYTLVGLFLTILIALGKRFLTKLETVNKAVNHVDEGQPTLTKRLDILSAKVDEREILNDKRHEENKAVLTELQIQTRSMSIVMDKVLMLQQLPQQSFSSQQNQ